MGMPFFDSFHLVSVFPFFLISLPLVALNAILSETWVSTQIIFSANFKKHWLKQPTGC